MDSYRMRRWAYGRLSRACAAAGVKCPTPERLNGLAMHEILDRIERLEDGAGQLAFGESLGESHEVTEFRK